MGISMDISMAAGVMIPLIGTSLGSAMVFFMRNQIHRKVEKLLMGFAAGVMVAASVWSLLIPSIEMAAEQGKVAWIPYRGAGAESRCRAAAKTPFPI